MNDALMIRKINNTIFLIISGLLLFSLPFVHAEEDSVTVPYSITGIDKDDYSDPLDGKLEFKKGETSKEITLTIKDNKDAEDDKVFEIKLDDSKELILSDKKTVSGTILNDDKEDFCAIRECVKGGEGVDRCVDGSLTFEPCRGARNACINGDTSFSCTSCGLGWEGIQGKPRHGC